MKDDEFISINKLINLIRDDPYVDGRTFSRIKRHIIELVKENPKNTQNGEIKCD